MFRRACRSSFLNSKKPSSFTCASPSPSPCPTTGRHASTSIPTGSSPTFSTLFNDSSKSTRSAFAGSTRSSGTFASASGFSGPGTFASASASASASTGLPGMAAGQSASMNGLASVKSQSASVMDASVSAVCLGPLRGRGMHVFTTWVFDDDR
ncbi:hypothetical protein HDU76_006854 [Blyttiomyces sp. JEL0837]|nr:hypothetical protein HDU76_006854 [Blyttiomyces sp. JEL0837]